MGNRRGLIHIYTGDGKGKTTAAVGLAVRAAGNGLRCLFCQFLKGRESGELAPLQTLGVELLRADCGPKFFCQMDENEKIACVKCHEMCYNKGKAALLSGEYDLVVLDEAFPAAALGLLPEDGLAELMRQKPESAELVLTGRDAPGGLMALADYVSEIRAVRHPYDRGIQARPGIEY